MSWFKKIWHWLFGSKKTSYKILSNKVYENQDLVTVKGGKYRRGDSLTMLTFKNCKKVVFNGDVIFDGNYDKSNDTVTGEPLVYFENVEEIYFQDVEIKNTPSIGMKFKGKQWSKLKNDDIPIKKIKIGHLIINDTKEAGLISQSIDTNVEIDSVKIIHSKRNVKYWGDIHLSSIEINSQAVDFDHGTTVNIGKIEGKNLNKSIFYAMNPKTMNIGEVDIDSCLYNEDGSDSEIYVHGLELFKFSNVVSPNPDTRKVHFGKVRITNTNFKDGLKYGNLDMFDAKVPIRYSLKAFWINSGTNNFTFDDVDVDMTMLVAPYSTAKDLTTGNHYFKELTIRNKKPYHMNIFHNSKIENLTCIDTYLTLKNMEVSNASLVDSRIIVDDKTVIYKSNINENSKIEVK